MGGLKRFGVSIESDLLRRFDKFASDLGYANRSEALRDMIREKLLAKDFGSDLARGKGEVTAVVSIVYDHHALDVQRIAAHRRPFGKRKVEVAFHHLIHRVGERQ